MKVLVLLTSVLLTLAKAEKDVKVIGGNATVTNAEDAPWIVSFQLYEKDYAFCAGTLVKAINATATESNSCSGWVITTATCVHDVPKDIILTLGNFKLMEDDANEIKLTIKDVTTHEKYSHAELSNDYDLALVEVGFNTTTKCDTIPTLDYHTPRNISEQDYGYMNASLFGWGLRTEEGPLQRVLYQVPLPLVTDLVCANYYGVEVFDAHSMNCAGGDGSGPCSYDTGGPLLTEYRSKNESFRFLHGLASFGVGCGRTFLPGVFTDVYNFVDWLDSKIPKKQEEEEVRTSKLLPPPGTQKFLDSSWEDWGSFDEYNYYWNSL